MMIYTFKSGAKSSIGSKHISFFGKMTFIKLTSDLDNGQGHQNKVISWDNPKGIPVQVWRQSN